MCASHKWHALQKSSALAEAQLLLVRQSVVVFDKHKVMRICLQSHPCGMGQLMAERCERGANCLLTLPTCCSDLSAVEGPLQLSHSYS